MLFFFSSFFSLPLPLPLFFPLYILPFRSTLAAANEIQKSSGIPKIQYFYYLDNIVNLSFSNNIRNLKTRKKKNMIVLILGGTSLLEIAAFRCLSEDSSFPFTIITACTKIINGASVIKALYHD